MCAAAECKCMTENEERDRERQQVRRTVLFCFACVGKKSQRKQVRTRVYENVTEGGILGG